MNRYGLFIVIVTVILLPLSAYTTELEYKSEYPPTYQLSLGYNFITLKGDRRVLEYSKADDSITFKGMVETYPLPHRFHLEVFTLSDDNYYLDTGYAYRDILLSRLVSIGMVHNHRHYDFSLPSVSSVLHYDERNKGDKYEEKASKTEFTLRLKVPNYPLHVFTRYFNYHKEGTVQQRFAIGYFDDLTKTSQSRDIDFDTKELTVGTNGHFGPLEIEYSHREKNFIAGADDTLRDSYPATSMRPADRFPHNLVPELRSSSDFLKIHTSYTGMIVGSLTLGNSRALNHFSGAKRESFYSGIQFSYIPLHELGFFIRWHYVDRDNTVDDVSMLRGDSYILTYPLRQSVDRKSNSISFNIRYRPLKTISVLGGYTLTSIKRSDTNDWPRLGQNTTRQSFSLKVYGRLLKRLRFRTEYIFTHTKNPVYNAAPERSHVVKLNTTYTPTAWLTGSLIYYFKKYSNNNLVYYEYFADERLETGERDTTIHNLLGLLTFIPQEKTSITIGAGLFRHRTKQSLVFTRFKGDGTYDIGPPLIEDGVPYKDESIQYLLSIAHRLNDRFDIGCDMRYVLSKGKLYTRTQKTSGIGDFSELNQKENGIDLRASYVIFNGAVLETKLSYSEFKDRVESDNSGRAYRALIMVTKKW